jgi:hypothetical protein
MRWNWWHSVPLRSVGIDVKFCAAAVSVFVFEREAKPLPGSTL